MGRPAEEQVWPVKQGAHCLKPELGRRLGAFSGSQKPHRVAKGPVTFQLFGIPVLLRGR